jgi:hypothetical protein
VGFLVDNMGLRQALLRTLWFCLSELFQQCCSLNLILLVSQGEAEDARKPCKYNIAVSEIKQHWVENNSNFCRF